MIYKTLHRKLKIEEHNPYLQPVGELDWHEGLAVPALSLSGTCHFTVTCKEMNII
jgi:hypothetical protein